MRLSFISLLLILSATLLYAQDQPVPTYLTQQNFPDSVANVKLVDLAGAHTTMGELIKTLKGRKIVVDIWASWCRDCIAGLPKVNQLREAHKSKNVAFVCLSVDDHDTKWRAAITKFDIQGEHYRIEGGWKNPLANYIVLDWIPRYLVLNESGRITMPKAIVADDKAITGALILK